MKMQLKNNRPNRYFILIPFFFALFAGIKVNAQLYSHNFGTTTISAHPYTVAPNIIQTNLSNSSWTNTTNAWTSNAGATGQAIALSTSTGTTTIHLKFTVAANYTATITSFNFWRQRSNSGPQNWTMTINGTTVGSGTSPVVGAPVGLTALGTPLAVTGNVDVAINLTNATGGNFRLDDFVLNGSVVSGCASAVSVTSFSPASGPAGTMITINGTGFTGATAVKFGTLSSTNFTVVSNTVIKAAIPAGVTTSTVAVINSTGCDGVSAGSFSQFISQCTGPVSATPDVYISELYDQKAGSGGMIELYNPTSATITFNGNYVLERYGDIGDTSPTPGYILALPGSIAGGATYLLGGTTPNQSICVTPAAAATFGNGFNGNDQFKLKKNGVVIDEARITLAAAGFTFRRKPAALAPSPNYNDNDWDIIPHGTGNDPSYCDDLGTRAFPPPPAVPAVVTKTICENGTATFSSALSNPAGYAYQWKILNGAAWANVVNDANYSGATTGTLTINQAPLSFNENQYYCQITSNSCSVKSNAAQLYVLTPPAIPTITALPPTCTTTTGTITVDTPLGTGLTYSINGTTFQASNIFTGVAPGPYTITVKNAGGCISTNTKTVDPAPGAPAAPVATATAQPTCTTGTGSITISSPIGAGLEYSLDGITFQTNPVFNSVAPGSYTIIVKNAAGCVKPSATPTVINSVPGAPVAPVASATTQPTCTTATGSITVSSPIGAGLEYSLDGITFQINPVFTTVAPGSYTITVKNAAGCTTPSATQTVINAVPGTPTAPVASATAQPTCTTNTGTITVSLPIGAGLEYSLDGVTFQINPVFNSVAPGSYTITVKNAAGCTTPSITQTVINAVPATPATPVASATTQPTCTTGTGSITVSSPTGAGFEYSLNGITFQANPVFTSVAPGSYTITVKNSAGCTTPSATQTVINTAPGTPVVPVASVTAQPTCTTNTGTITVSSPTGTGFEYSVDGINFLPTTVFSGLPPDSYTITVKNASGCINTSAAPVVINPAPGAPAVPVASATAQPTCTTATGSITVSSPTGAGLEYSLDGITFQTNPVFSSVAPGNYTITVKNAAGCTKPSATQTVINPVPATPAAPIAAATTQPTCITATGSITVSSPTGAGFEYSLDGITFQANPVFTSVSTGSYTITVKNASGCTKPSATQTVINAVPAMPVAPVASATAQPTCTTATGSITVSSPTGAGFEYSLDGITFQANPVFTSVAPGNYTITVKNAAGCTTPSATQTVINAVPATPVAPVATATTQPTCTTGTGSITVSSPTGAGLEYSLDGIAFQTNPVFNSVAPGSYTITVKNAAGCKTPSATQTVINAVPGTPAAPVAGATAQPTCSTNTGTITITSPTGTGFEYSVDGINFLPTTVFSGLPPDSYTITVKNASGCINTSVAPVVINPAPITPAVPIASATTQPTCTTVTGAITITSPTGAGLEYSLDGIAFQTNPVFNSVAPGNYTITVKNAAGCTTPSSTQTVINNAPVTPAAPVASATTQPTCTTGTGSITVSSPTGAGLEYSLDGIAFQASPLFNTIAPGSYTITVKNAAGCTTPSATQIIVNPVPATPAAPVASATAQPGCTTANGTITVTSPTGAGYTYSIDGTAFQVNPVFNTAPGSYTITVKNAAGCTASAVTPIVINTAPAAPSTPVVSATTQPACNTTTGVITVNSPTGTGLEYSINGTTFQTGTVFSSVAPGSYTITVKNGAGCTTPSAAQTVINAVPAAPAAPVASATAQPSCSTNTGTITITSPTGAGLEYSLDGTNFQPTAVFSGLPPDSYTITVRNTAGCTSTSPTATIINAVPVTPAAPVAAATQPTCLVNTGTITVSSPTGTGFTYSLNGSTFQASPVFNTVVPGSYTVTVKNTDGCTKPSAAPIVINAVPVPSAPIATATHPACTTTTGTITVSPQSGTGITYSIDGVNFQAGNIFNNVAPGNYTITVKNAGGCTKSSASQTTVNPIPAAPAVPVATATAQPTCSNPNGIITFASPTGTGFTYSIGGSFQASPTFSNVATGSYTISVKNAAGCVTTSATQTTINVQPAAPAVPVTSTIQPTCAVATGTITVSSPTGTGFEYSINNGLFQNSPLFNNLAPGSYVITVKNPAGCTRVATNPTIINIVPNAPAAPVATATQPTCTNPNGIITVASPTGTGFTYSINGTAFQNSPVFNNVAPGNYTITVKNTAGCTTISAAPVVINTAPAAPPVPVASATIQPACTTTTGEITVSSPVGTGITYSIDGTNYQTSNVFTGVLPGNYFITIMNAAGCTKTSAGRVFINTVPGTPVTPDAVVIQPTCAVPSGSITVTSPIATGLLYSIDGINFQPGRVFANLAAANYTLTVKNNAGCSSVSATPLVINAAPPAAGSPGSITGNNQVCVNDTLQLTNTVTTGTWASNNTAVATVDANGLVTAHAPGWANITYTVGAQCTATASKTITVNSLPLPVLSDKYYLCVDNDNGNILRDVTLHSGLSASTHSFTWIKDGITLTATGNSLTTTAAGQYEVIATSLATGCSGSDTATVGISSIALAYAEVGEDFNHNQNIKIYVTGGSGEYQYQLEDGPLQDEPYFDDIYQGEYTITIWDKNGCGSTELKVYALNYPRFFTPNGDGSNDTWNIKGLYPQKEALIYIFDRYGKLITSVKPGQNGWDGTFNGERLPATDYWFKLLYRSRNGEQKEFKAHISLLR